MHYSMLTHTLLASLTLFTTLTTAFPYHLLDPRELAIPGPPSDPPKAATGDGIGPYGNESAGVTDYAAWAEYETIAETAASIGLVHAAAHLEHYLGNTGSDYNDSPETMMNDLPKFRDAAKALAQNEAAAAWNRILDASGELAFSSTWSGFYAEKDQSMDWYYSVGGFSFAVTGVVSKNGQSGSLRYKIHVFDRYNWDDGKSTTIGPFTFYDRDLGSLHLKGLAREYIVRGSGGVNTVTDFKATTVIPPPSTGGRS
ncbi:hypothetical protein GP486_002067 [Trichoglossum hirsutum]|uniref:Uncharacterized protein n=1 Tax=Trichoglossum hirsutum TaxID=265104 RepID=A0A9P8LFM5_9PEZI|nr:hypothetical protein GP486_002067 [Trichoglossum hirsutum]